jgi:hypothetical protein
MANTKKPRASKPKGELGYYTSKSGPAAAAKKAATKRFGSGASSLTLTIRETGTKREFKYRLTREKLATPYVSTIAGKQIVRKYATQCKAI